MIEFEQTIEFCALVANTHTLVHMIGAAPAKEDNPGTLQTHSRFN